MLRSVTVFIFLLFKCGLWLNGQGFRDTVKIDEHFERIYHRRSITCEGKSANDTDNSKVIVHIGLRRIDPLKDSALHENLCRMVYAASDPSVLIQVIDKRGNLVKQYSYDCEHYTGRYVVYYANGNIKRVGSYDEKGKKNGVWIYYKRDGTIKKKKNYT